MGSISVKIPIVVEFCSFFIYIGPSAVPQHYTLNLAASDESFCLISLIPNDFNRGPSPKSRRIIGVACGPTPRFSDETP
jgi:hypothetical protein